jgi:pimeloyl-ACP methyl ester carboxylesterase
MGGSVALLYAGSFPDRPERVVAMESIHVPETPDEDLAHRAADWILSVRRARLRGPRPFASIDACAERIRQFDPLCPPEVALFLAERGTLPVSRGRAFKHDPVHVTRGPYPFRLAQSQAYWRAVRCPVLLLEAAHSEIPPPPDMGRRVASFRSVRRQAIPGAGHMMMRHRPEAVARALLEFLASR